MNVVGLVDAPDHVCCRYRVRAFEPSLKAANHSLRIESIPGGVWRRHQVLRQSERADIVLLQRRLLHAFHWLTLRRSAKRLLFDFDDAVLFRDSYSSRGPYSQRRLARFRRTVAACDAVLAGNNFLADQAARFTNPRNVTVIPTCIDVARYPVARHDSQHDGLRLVWIGSSSTLPSLKLARPALERAARSIHGLRLVVICDRFPEFHELEVEQCVWSPHGELDQLASADVGVSVLPDDLWSRGKCGLKVLQYMAAGLPVVANSVGVHSSIIRHGETGFLVDTPQEWQDALHALATDRGLRLRMGERARQVVEAEFSVERWAPRFREAVVG